MSQPYPFGTEELSNDMIWIGSVCGIVSLIALLYVIISYIMHKDGRQNHFFFLIVNICIMDICFMVSAIPLLTLTAGEMGTGNDPVCTTFGVVRVFANLSSYFLNSLFAWAIYCSLAIATEEVKLSSYYYRKVIIIYIVSFIASLLPLSSDSIGKGTLFCDLKANTAPWNLVWQILDYIVPFLISFCSILTLMTITIWRVTKKYSDASIGQKLLRLLFFPTIFLLVNSGAFGSRILTLFQTPPLWLTIYHFLGRQLQGAIHGGIYGFVFLLDRPKPGAEELKNIKISRSSSIATNPEFDDSSTDRRISEFY